MSASERIDPAWAWSPFEPDEKTPWNPHRAAHLYRRAGFAATRAEIDAAVEHGPAAAVARLFAAEEDADCRDSIRRMAEAVVASGPQRLPAWWLYRMTTTPDQLREKATFFWHGHFATSSEKGEDGRLMLAQNRLLRRHALDRFGPLVHGIARDPAMLIYLDSPTNRKRHPHENFARELMELFCLGEGNYTERDIQEMARCFTGWEVHNGRFRFNEYQHDDGEKAFLSRRGRFGGDDAVRIVLEQPSLPPYVVGKLYRFFIADEPAPPRQLIAPLAAEFRDTGLDVGHVLRRMLSSNLFFSAHALGRKVRSPVELAVGLLRALEGRTNFNRLSSDLRPLGQRPFYPPSVKGWDGGRTWINSSTLLARAAAVKKLIEGPQMVGGDGTLRRLADRHRLSSGKRIVDFLSELLLAVDVPGEVRADLIRLADGRGPVDRRLADCVQAMAALPEFQLA